MLRGYGNVNNKLQCMCVPMHAHAYTCIQMLVEVRDIVFPQAVSAFVCVCVWDKITCWTWSSLSLQCSLANKLHKSICLYFFSKLELQIHDMSVWIQSHFLMLISIISPTESWIQLQQWSSWDKLQVDYRASLRQLPRTFSERENSNCEDLWVFSES